MVLDCYIFVEHQNKNNFQDPINHVSLYASDELCGIQWHIYAKRS